MGLGEISLGEMGLGEMGQNRCSNPEKFCLGTWPNLDFIEIVIVVVLVVVVNVLIYPNY